MDVSSIAYLLRYVFTLFIAIIAIKLLVSAIKELRWSMKHILRPAQGYFLLNQKSDGSTRSLPLYHTTNIGRAKSNDLRIHSKDINRHHAVIYRYDGSWFIRPQSSSANIIVNNKKISSETELSNGDEINFTSARFIFVDEPSMSASRGEVYEDAIYDDEAFLRAVDKNSNPPYLAWLFLNIFTIIATLIVYLQLPELPELKKYYLIFIGLAMGVIDVVFLILPVTLRYSDRVLFLAASQLTMIGLAIQARLSLINNYSYLSALDSGDQAEVFKVAKSIFRGFATQVIALLIGLVLLLIIAKIVSKTRFLEYMVVACAVITPLLLLATLVLGYGGDTNGATLWINLGAFSIQLTEFAKISYLITLAGFFKNRPPLKTQIIFAVWAAVVFFLYLLLPDLGSLMILVPTTLIVFVVMSSEYLKTLLILVAASVMGVVGYWIFPHVRRRIDGWASLWTEVNDSNRQVVYGLQAMGRGNIFGKGLGNGSPGGIPLVESDMVFSITVEEFGIIVGICIFILLFVILLRGIRVNILARDGFTSSLGLAFGTVIFVEALVVIGGTTGLIPLTGATLPFIASGGSSMLAKWFIIALLLGLASRQELGANKIKGSNKAKSNKSNSDVEVEMTVKPESTRASVNVNPDNINNQGDEPDEEAY